MTKVPMTLPDRSALRVLYDEAVAEISKHRKTSLYTTPFYAKIGDAFFDTAYTALLDTITGTRRLHTFSAPVGAGKTTFSYAFIAAMTHYADTVPEAPCGAVFVVEEREKANDAYIELETYLPGKVSIWSSDHDKQRPKGERVKNPAAKFAQEELRLYPVAIVTHKFYLGSKGHNATSVVRAGSGLRQRALTVVDERPAEAPSFEITLSEAEKVREALSLTEGYQEAKAHIGTLLRFMEDCHYDASTKLWRPGIEWDWETVSKELGWFKSSEAEWLSKSASNILGIDKETVKKLLSFGKALVHGRACAAITGQSLCFFAYETQRVIDRSEGAILLDATADIDGVSSIVPWRVEAHTPKACYDNLQITHVPQHTKKNLKQYFRSAANQRAYVAWAIEMIKQHMEPGEKGLVICKKDLVDQERIPNWGEGDPRFKDRESYTEEYGWDLEGGKLCVSYWGTGVGSNAWKEADAVFLLDEFYLPRHVAVATTQGLRNQKTNEGDLAKMTAINSKVVGVNSIAEGHVLRWTKQLALRGRGRIYDEYGVCGKQRLSAVILSGSWRTLRSYFREQRSRRSVTLLRELR